MRVCVAMRSGVPANPREGNVRGEARWERQVFEACLSNPEITELYTYGGRWQGRDPKYKGLLSAQAAPETILVAHDYNVSILNAHPYKMIIANIFGGPWEEQRGDVEALSAKMGKRLVFTVSFSALKHTHYPYLGTFIPEENVTYLPLPGASYVTEGSNFGNNILLWPYRIIFLSAVYEAEPVLWAFDKMLENPELQFRMVVGWSTGEAKDYVNEEVIKIRNMTQYFWDVPSMKKYESLKPRVRLDMACSHQELLNIYQHTKICIPHYRYYGGPPIEAAMHGVPFVGTSMEEGAFFECSDYLTASTTKELRELLDRLLTDEVFYNDVANGYRNFARDTYGYEAFNKNLNKIIEERL